MSGLVLSTQAQRAYDELQRRSKKLDAYSFNHSMKAEVLCEDGSSFRVSDAFITEWTDPLNATRWVFMFCEHYPAMFWAVDDLAYYANLHVKNAHHGAYR
jgi:hypothetical protein